MGRRTNNATIATETPNRRSHQRIVGASGLNITTTRWLKRRFKSQAAQNQWCDKHKHELQIVPLFVDNNYVVEFRKLKQL